MLKRLMPTSVPIVLGLAVALTGCRPQAPTGKFSVVQPDTIQVDGTEWTKVEWTPKIDSKVARHFSKTPEVADNPSLSGQSVCYTNGSTERVYWLLPVDDTCQWAMVEFKGSRGSELVEGSGAPFLQLLALDD